MIISLLTDFGLRDNFVGVIKGVILGIDPGIKLVDISHEVPQGDISQAAFLLKSSYKYFPCGTVHLVVVDPGVGSRRKAIIVKTPRYYFIGPDNGVLSLALEREKRIENIVSITNRRFFLEPVSNTFHGRDIFAPVAAHLVCGRDINEFGIPQDGYQQLEFPSPKIIQIRKHVTYGKNRVLQGEIIYIDHFGNLITNIQKDIFKRFVGKRRFFICLGEERVIGRINKNYSQTPKGSPLSIFGSSGNLEISVNCGSAREYFGASVGQIVKIY